MNGRPRRIGWIDTVVLRHTKRVSGITGLSVMLLDVLSNIENLKICTHYMLNGTKIDHIPANIDDFEEVFRFLYDKADEYLPGKAGTAAFLINEHQYKANFRIDKEINIMSLINNLINNK